MEIKKTKKANLENKRMIIFQSGLVIALSLILVAFEWNSAKHNDTDLGSLTGVNAEEEIIPITRFKEPPPPPPPPPAQRAIEELIVVDDETEINDELDLIDSEADENMYVEPVFIEEPEEEEETVFIIVQDMPQFPGGDLELRKYIAGNVHYPEIAKENGIQGRVFVQFVVNAKGFVEQTKIARGVDPSLDKEALRIIKSLPKWEPGKQRGKPVKVQFTVPINFVLAN